MEIVFNGKSCVTQSANLLELLKEFDLEGKKVAIEVNREIVPRTTFGETPLAPGDVIEVVHFVGGG